MNDKKNYKKGIRREIVELTLAMGVLPYRSMKLLRKNTECYRKKILAMEKEGLLEIHREKNAWGVSFTDLQKVVDECDEIIENKKLFRYYELFGREDWKKLSYSSITNKRRILRNSESYLFMYGANVACKLGEKVSLQNHEEATCVPTYYTIRELKRYGEFQDDVEEKDGKKLVSSARANGLVVNPKESLLVYNVGTHVLEFNYGEMKLKMYTDNMLRTKGLPRVAGGLLLLKDNGIQKYLRPETTRSQNYVMRLEEIYSHLYALPLDETGQQMMELMMLADWQDKMRVTYLPKECSRPSELSAVDCDGENGNKHFLIHCVPDIKRLRQFVFRAEFEGKRENYIIICFDFQEEDVEKLASNSCEIYSASFKEYYEYMKGGV